VVCSFTIEKLDFVCSNRSVILFAKFVSLLCFREEILTIVSALSVDSVYHTPASKVSQTPNLTIILMEFKHYVRLAQVLAICVLDTMESDLWITCNLSCSIFLYILIDYFRKMMQSLSGTNLWQAKVTT